MRLFVISDNQDTCLGMQLAGVDGVIVNGVAEFQNAVNKALSDKEIGILLINENLCSLDENLIDNIKLKQSKPLIVEIPDRYGSGRSEDFITDYIKDAIGINI